MIFGSGSLSHMPRWTRPTGAMTICEVIPCISGYSPEAGGGMSARSGFSGTVALGVAWGGGGGGGPWVWLVAASDVPAPA